MADTDNDRIQKFTPDGKLITKFGEKGPNPGQSYKPMGISILQEGNVYIVDSSNYRIQVFRIEDPSNGRSKAIIAAWGGHYPGNYLWNQTQMWANNAYWNILLKGILKGNIRYFGANTNCDLDEKSLLDDIYPTSLDALQEAITSWALDAECLVVYLTGRGNNSTFRLSEEEELGISDLDMWLDTLQGMTSCRVMLVYDVYDENVSGGFLSAFRPPSQVKRG